jgi:signal transduction histidine kinase
MTHDNGPRSLRRAVIALVLTALSAFALVGVAAVVASRQIAERTALSEAERSAQTLSKVVFAPAIPAVLEGDEDAHVRLDEAVRARKEHGGVARIKVWSREGVVLYSDAPTAVGRKFPLDKDISLAIDHGTSQTAISDLSDDENFSEPREVLGDHLVEVYVPLVLESGGTLCLEVYTTTARVDRARTELTGSVVTYALLSLMLLVLAQLPISIGLIRRASRADAERRRLLANALTASERERQSIARDLHDGVVQDLAGVSYAMGALRTALPPDTTPRARAAFDGVASTVRSAVSSLRTLMVDIYPPDLTATGLPFAIEELAKRLRRNGIDVSVKVDIGDQLRSELAAAIYRAVRECSSNIARHSGAGHAWIEIGADDRQLVVRVADDGHGLHPGDDPGPGHLGIQLVHDGIRELGGELTMGPRAEGGTEVVIRLPRTA